MSNLLSTAKKILIDRAIDLYETRRMDLDLDFNIESYKDHYTDLGALIFQIDSCKSFGDILNDIEKDNLQELNYFAGDENVIEDFIAEVQNSQ